MAKRTKGSSFVTNLTTFILLFRENLLNLLLMFKRLVTAWRISKYTQTLWRRCLSLHTYESSEKTISISIRSFHLFAIQLNRT
jgi:hypothetical protein